jgi:cytochrome bd-type quinol oxidase subunit 1
VRLDPVILSRIQFAWIIGWLAFLEGAYALTRRPVFISLSQFWLRIFAISFGMGVVTGIVMPFQFGTNWSRFSDAAGNVISPLLAYEGLTAFFLEATFLGVLLFGRKLAPPSMHFVAALLVAVGTLSSSFWILATNSWMQTPAGYEIVDHETRGGSRSLTIWKERWEMRRSYHGHFPFSAFVTPRRIFVRFNALFLHRMVVSTKMAAFQQVNGPANLEVVLC